MKPEFVTKHFIPIALDTYFRGNSQELAFCDKLKMDYVEREVRVTSYPWMYGIACELVRGDSPIDRIPPYNMLHYGGSEPYFNQD